MPVQTKEYLIDKLNRGETRHKQYFIDLIETIFAAQGHDAFVYIAYADDADGTGFTLVFNPSKDYIAILSSEVEIESPQQEDFNGLWKNYKGQKGDTGDPGQDAFVYIAYADADDGTGFTLLFNPSKDYIAILSTDTEIASPQQTHFAGLWKKYKGEQGIPGIPADSIAARVFNSVNQSIPNNTDTVLNFDSENFDTDGIHSSANNSRITCTIAGIYKVDGQVNLAAHTGGRKILRIRKNGSEVIATAREKLDDGEVLTSEESRLSITTMVQLISGDYLELIINQNSGGAVNAVAGNSETWFSMVRQAGIGHDKYSLQTFSSDTHPTDKRLGWVLMAGEGQYHRQFDHQLGKVTSVTLRDNNGECVEARVVLNDTNSVVIAYASPEAGTIALN